MILTFILDAKGTQVALHSCVKIFVYINPCYCLIPVELLNNLNVRIPGYPMILFPHGADKN